MTLLLAHERIRHSFGADFRRRAVTGQHGHVVAKWEKFLPNSVKQKIDISAGQVPSSDAAGKEDIAANEQIIFARKETKTAGTMPRHFENLKFRSEKISSRRFFDQEVRLGRFDFQFKAEVPKKFPVRNHRGGRGMTANLAFEAMFDFCDVLNVVDVAVSKQQHF